MTDSKTETKATTMRPTGKAYATVLDMVRDTASESFAEEYEQYASERQLVNAMIVLRGVKGLTQSALAEKMNFGQSKVSKMESSTDADLTFGDFLLYAKHLGQSVRILLSPASADDVNHMRFHAACLDHELEHRVRLGGTEDGVEGFAIETIRGMLAMIQESISKLRHRAEKPAPLIRVEVEGDRGERLPFEAPRPRRGRPRKPVAT